MTELYQQLCSCQAHQGSSFQRVGDEIENASISQISPQGIEKAE
jgi:hypothetical protein